MATAIRGRLVRQTTKQPLQGIIIEAINVTTGVAASSTTTTDTEGFYSLTGLTDATYFANPLVAGDDWIIQPDTNVLFGGAIYIPDDATTPRVQITNADFGGIVGLDTGDTYDDSDGSGTYQFLLSQNDGKAYFGGGAAVLDSSGITITGDSTINITGSVTTGSAANYKAINEVITGTIGNAKSITGIFQSITHNTTDTSGGVRGFYADITANANLTSVTNLNAAVTVASGKTVGTYIGANVGTLSAGNITDGYGFAASLTVGGGTTIRGFVVSALSGATNNRGIEIAAPASGANNYAIYSSATAQSVHAGNLRIGSTTAPTVALDVTGSAAVSGTLTANLGLTNGSVELGTPSSASGIILRADSATKQRADILRTTTGLLIRVRDSNNAASNATITIADGSGDVAGTVTIGDTLATVGDLTVGNTTASADKSVRIPDNSGNNDRVLTRVTSGNHVYVGDIDNNSGDLNLRAGGSTRIQLVSGGAITITDGVNIALATTTGTKIGTATTQKLGFFNATPVVRQTAPAAAPAGGTGVAAGGWSSATNRDTAINCINGIRTALINLGLIG